MSAIKQTSTVALVRIARAIESGRCVLPLDSFQVGAYAPVALADDLAVELNALGSVAEIIAFARGARVADVAAQERNNRQ